MLLEVLAGLSTRTASSGEMRPWGLGLWAGGEAVLWTEPLGVICILGEGKKIQDRKVTGTKTANRIRPTEKTKGLGEWYNLREQRD